MSKIMFTEMKDCCGCEACVSACPVNIIEMVKDEEGFLYPKVVEDLQCIHCDYCVKVCPIKNVEKTPEFNEEGYAGYSESDEEIKSCASGGLASAISRKFIDEKRGVVYGVEYSNNCLDVLYGRAENVNDIEKFKTSKYVQARKGTIYQSVKKDLLGGRKVLFIGLPCECYALKRYVDEKSDGLFVCALMCHGPSSQEVHRQYCQMAINKHPGIITEFSVRYKKVGWKPYYIRVKFQDGYEYLEKFADSTYGTAFLYMKRPSCNECRIKREAIHADITIGDFHVAYEGKVQPYNFYGVSSAIVHTKKGYDLIDDLDKFKLSPVSVKSVLYSEAYCKAIPALSNRKEFGKVFSKSGLEEACKLPSIKRIERKKEINNMIRTYGSKVKRLVLNRK